MRRTIIVSIVSAFAGLSVACTVDAESVDDLATEEVGVTQQALANNGGDPLLPSVCRACGCTWEPTVKDGCTTYRCVCSTQKDADCVVKAPGGSAALELAPPPPPKKFPPIVTNPGVVLSP